MDNKVQNIQATENNRARLPAGQRFALVCCLIASLSGVLVLFAWLLNIDVLLNLRPGLPTMKFNTALCFILTGSALLSFLPAFSSRVWLSRLFATGALLISALTLLQYILGVNTGIDELVVADTHNPTSTPAGRMSIATTLSFIFLSCSILLCSSTRNDFHKLSQLMALPVTLIAGTALLGYVFGVQHFRLYFLSSIALHTSILFMLLGLAVLFAQAETGFMKTLSSQGIGSTQARKLLPVVIAAPTAIGWLVLQGITTSQYTAEFAFALSSLASIIFLVTLVWFSADALNLEEERFSSTIEQAPVAIVMLNTRGKIILANCMVERLFQYNRKELTGKLFEVLIKERFHGGFSAFREEFFKEQDRAMETEQLLTGIRKNGEEFQVEVAFQLVNDACGNFVIVTIIDITERISAEQKILRLSRFHRVLSDINNLIVRVQDRDELFRESTRITVEAGKLPAAWIGLVDETAQEITIVASYTLDKEVRGFVEEQTRWFYGYTDVPYTFSECINNKCTVIVNDVQTDARVRIKSQLEDLNVHSFAAMPLILDDRVVAVFAIHARESHYFDQEETNLAQELANDIAFAMKHIARLQQVEYLASYDSVTGLPNRNLFHDRLKQALYLANFYQLGAAVLFIDIDRFKQINDSLGLLAGDEILIEAAKRISACVRITDTISRRGGDEFVIVLPGDPDNERNSSYVAEKILSAFSNLFALSSEKTLLLSCSIGIAEYPVDGDDPDLLVKKAEIAVAEVKARGGSNFLYYQDELFVEEDLLDLENELRLAIKNNDLFLYYQPKVEISSGKIVGVEALLRWRHPTRGMIPPDSFIPLAEKTGLILPIGNWLLKEACLQAKSWQGIEMAINLSVIQFRQDNILEIIKTVLDETGLEPERLELELTESIFIENSSTFLEKLKSFNKLGIQITLDDFGTGYSSLSYLRSFPFDTVKIDKSFIADIASNSESKIIVNTIIAMTHSLGHKVIAEGVETQEQLDILRAQGCDQIQGYLISRPVPPEALAKILDSVK